MNMISIKLIFIKVLSRVHNYLNKSINYRLVKCQKYTFNIDKI